MKNEKIEQLLQRYLEAQTSTDEEKELALYFREAADLPAEWEVYRTIFSEEHAMQFLTSEKLEDDQWLFAKITDETIGSTQNQRFIVPAWAKNLAASLVLIGCGIVIGQLMNLQRTEKSQNHEVAALRNDLLEVRKMLFINMLQQPRASQRIQAVYNSQEMQVADESLVAALSEVLQQDESVNVRLAALEALGRFAQQEPVKKMLLHEMVAQNEPLVQLSIMELMVELNEKEAIAPLKQLSQNDELPASVRQEAEMSLHQLL